MSGDLRKIVQQAKSECTDSCEVLSILAEYDWIYYSSLKKQGFSQDQAFELTKIRNQ